MTGSASMSAAVAACLLCACSSIDPPRAPAAKVGLLPCEDAQAWQDELNLLDAGTLLKVEPTTWQDTCNGAFTITGTRFLVRSPEASSEKLAKLLQCPSGRVLVGEVDSAQPAGGGLQLPEGWVDIDVKREAGHYAVRLSAANVAKNIQLLHRATAFARARSR
jgi:hypothetical protein